MKPQFNSARPQVPPQSLSLGKNSQPDVSRHRLSVGGSWICRSASCSCGRWRRRPRPRPARWWCAPWTCAWAPAAAAVARMVRRHSLPPGGAVGPRWRCGGGNLLAVFYFTTLQFLHRLGHSLGVLLLLDLLPGPVWVCGSLPFGLRRRRCLLLWFCWAALDLQLHLRFLHRLFGSIVVGFLSALLLWGLCVSFPLLQKRDRELWDALAQRFSTSGPRICFDWVVASWAIPFF